MEQKMKNTPLMLFTIILFTFNLLCEGQINRYKEQFKDIEQCADSLKKQQQFNLSIKERLGIQKIDTTYAQNLYELSALYSITQKKDSAYLYLVPSLSGDSTLDVLVNPDFIFICKDDRWKDIQNNQISKFEAINGKFKNLPLAIKLWEMKMKDQSYYVFMDYTKQEEVKKFWQIKDSINKINLNELDSIIQESGWPKISEVGKHGSVSAFLIIQHSEYAIQKKYFHYLKKAVKQNEAYPKDLALLTDRIRLHEKKKQIYGSQISWDPVTQKEYFDYSKLKKPAYVNKRRKSVGLGPIEDYVKFWNITWDYKKR